MASSIRSVRSIERKPTSCRKYTPKTPPDETPSREKLEAQRKAQAAAATATTTASSPTTTAKETDELDPPIDPIPYSTHPSDSPPKSALTQDDVATLQDLFEKL
ncbi:hypothetical protein Ae201684P_010008 [Aphanomyces euteiches]|nr:hypothetical protein Ae201684P_010008 [Aphanomyces euteiches]